MPSLAVSTTVQTGSTVSAGTAASSLRPANRTFSLTGVLGTAIVKGDVVALWGSNDGGTTYQPLRQGNNEPVQLNFYNPEVVINDCCDHYATQRLAVGSGSALNSAGFNGEGVFVNPTPAWVQGGNSGFAPVGILGTTDAVPFRIIAQGIDIFDSDGSTSSFGNLNATVPGNTLFLQSGSGGIGMNADGGGNIDISTTGAGGISVSTGTGPINIGTTVAKAIAMGNGTGATQITISTGTGGAAFAANATDHSTSLGSVTGISPTSLRAGTGALALTRNGVTWGWPNADATLANKSLVSDGAGNLSFANAIQSGAANLTNGVSAAIPANISATSRIFIQAADVVPGAGNLTIGYRPLAADRVNGTPGSFKITAVIAAGTINTLDQSQGIMWFVLNA